MKRKLWMDIHTYLSLFFFPAALIYALTGVLYIFEIRQNSGADIIDIPLDSLPESGKEQEFILDILEKNHLKIPSNTQVRVGRGSASMGSIKYSAVMTRDREDKPILRVTNRNLYGVLMLLHKSGGSKFELGGFRFSFFDFIAIFFGSCLVLFYLSGLIVTAFCKRNRKAALAVCGAGFVVTALAVYFSV